MGSEKRKKARERFLLDRFLECQGLTPTSIGTPEPPSPDFLIELDGRKVGIEITEIYPQSPRSYSGLDGPGPPQAIESRGGKIVSLAKEAYFRRNDSPLLVTVVFSNIETIRRKEEHEKLAELIALEVEDMASKALATEDRRPDFFTGVDNPLCDSVALIHIYKVPELRFARWTVPKVGLVRKLTSELLQDRITTKEKKLDGYRRDGDEVWLLMVADRLSASRKFFYPPDFPADDISSKFSRTFYYCYGVDDLVVEFC